MQAVTWRVPGAVSRDQQGRDALDAVAAPGHTTPAAAPGSPRSVDSGHGRVALRSAHRRGGGPVERALASSPAPSRSLQPGSPAATTTLGRLEPSGVPRNPAALMPLQ